MADLEDLKGLVDKIEYSGILNERSLEAYVSYSTYAIFTLKEYVYGRDLAKSTIDKINDTVKAAGFKDIWEMERLTKDMGGTYLLEGFYKLCLLRSFWDFEAYIYYMEQDRPQEKRFYLPRRNPLEIAVHDLEDLGNHKIKVYGVVLG